MAGAALALFVLIALPLAFLVGGGLTGAGCLRLAHFRDAVSSRLYVQALRNSLILGAATAMLSVAVGLPLAWAVSRTNVPAKRFIHLTAIVSYLTPPFLTAIAFVNLFSPRFVPLEYDVTCRAIVNSLILASGTATLALLIGLFAGWLLVFVPALQELSASVLLFSSGSITLAVAVYNLYETGALGPVAALAIVTMLIIAGAIVLATRLGRGTAVARAERAGVAQ